VKPASVRQGVHRRREQAVRLQRRGVPADDTDVSATKRFSTVATGMVGPDPPGATIYIDRDHGTLWGGSNDDGDD
jgi:hypothetical protein